MAIDELLIHLPDTSSVDDLISQVAAVPGVNVEDVHPVDPQRQDQSVLALDVAARIVEAPRGNRLAVACSLIRSMFEADWCTAVGMSIPDVADGTLPDQAWLLAFLEGIRHLDIDEGLDHTPSDIAWAPMARQEGFIVCGRQSRSFRSRERQHLALVVRIVDSVVSPVSAALDGS